MSLYLKPFTVEKHLINREIAVNISFENKLLTLDYLVRGDIENLVIPLSNTNPTRKDNLWETTCFEFFLGVVNSPIYWEFNLSPSGDWNVYSFTNYRQGMTKESAFNSLPFSFTSLPDSLQLQITIDTSLIIPDNSNIIISITTVLQERNGNISYWALHHRGKEADFHCRDSFITMEF